MFVCACIRGRERDRVGEEGREGGKVSEWQKLKASSSKDRSKYSCPYS